LTNQATTQYLLEQGFK